MDFFRNLKPLPGAIEAMNILQNSNKYELNILTRPSIHNPLCYTEKRVWIENHLGYDWCEKLIICPNKALLKGDYLVDDYLWEDFEGEQIQYGKGEFTSWSIVYDYLLSKVKG